MRDANQIPIEVLRNNFGHFPLPRLMPVETNCFEPIMSEGDMVAVVPVNRFLTCGLYVLDIETTLVIRRVTGNPSGFVILTKDSEYKAHGEIDRMTMNQFSEVVVGRISTVCRSIWTPKYQ